MSNQPKEMSFLDHLEELRWHLIRSAVVVFVLAILAFFFKDFIFNDILFAPKKGDFITYRFFCYLSKYIGAVSEFCGKDLPFIIQNRTMAGQFSAHIWTSIWAGIIVGFPFIVYEFWKFISPGLYENERKLALRFIFTASMLFFLGVVFGYYIITPLSIRFLGGYAVSPDVVNQIDLSSYISIIRSTVLSCGVVFELPICIYFLARLGLISVEFMRSYRKHALIVVLILAAIITPPDVMSQIIVSIPIMILYEISIYVVKFVTKQETQTKK